jgi:hypothetical protein
LLRCMTPEVALRDILHRHASSVANGVAEIDRPPSGAEDDARDHPSNRKRRKQSSRHLGRKFLKQSQRPWHVAVAQMHERKVKGAKAPVRHDFDEASITHELGLNDRRQIADAAAGEESRRQAEKVIHREVRLERDSLLVLAVGIEKGPTAFWCPM